MIVSVAQAPLHAGELQRAQLVTACFLRRLDGADGVAAMALHRHDLLVFEAMRAATQHSDEYALLVEHFDVIDAGAAAQR